MRLKFGDIVADVAGLWTNARDVVLPVVGVFFLLPLLAINLFVPQPDMSGLADDALLAAQQAHLSDLLPWLAGMALLQTYGVGLLLTMLLDQRRPTLGTAMGRTLRLLPGLLGAQLIVGAGVTLGFVALIVPGVYLAGRLTLTTASYLVAPQKGAVAAVVTGFGKTSGNGLLLMLIWGSAMGASSLIGAISDALSSIAVSGGPLLLAMIALLGAAGVTACATFLILAQAAVYRAVSPPRTGT